MKTLALFRNSTTATLVSTSWYLDVLGELRGKQELYTQQSPRKLEALRERAIVESAVTWNSIGGVSITSFADREPARRNQTAGSRLRSQTGIRDHKMKSARAF
jgi:hypothetical protein